MYGLPNIRNLVQRVDKISTKMTAMEELEKREKELTSMLALADSLEERKLLREELREIRKQIFERPTVSTTTKKDYHSNVSYENKKNESKIEEEVQNITAIENKSIVKTKNEKEDMSVTIRQSYVSDDNNNNVTESKSNDTGAIHVTPVDVREARRAKRAAHMNRLAAQGNSVDKVEIPKINSVVNVDSVAKPENNSTKTKTSNEAPGKQIITIRTSLNNNAETKTEDAEKTSSLRRTATWSPKTNARKNIANTLSVNKKYGAQAGPSPLTFGTSYTTQNKEETKKPIRNFSINKYTPTVPQPVARTSFAPVKSPVKIEESNPSTKHVAEEAEITTRPRENSFNKYNTPVQNIIDYKKERTLSDIEPLAISFVPRKISPTGISSKFESVASRSTSSISKKFEQVANRSAGSYNKYNQGLSQASKKFNSDNNSGVRRVASVRVRPTYEKSTITTTTSKRTATFHMGTMNQNANLDDAVADNKNAVKATTGLDSIRKSRSLSNGINNDTDAVNNTANSVTITTNGTTSVNSIIVKNRGFSNGPENENDAANNTDNSVAVTSNGTAAVNSVSVNRNSYIENDSSIENTKTNYRRSLGVKSYAEKQAAPVRDRPVSPFAANRLSTGSNFPRSTSPRPSPRSSPRFDRKNKGPEPEPPVFSQNGQKSSVADRMAMFREAQEKEKKQVEKQKAQEEQRKRLSSAPAGVKEEPKPIEKKELEEEKPEMKDSEKMKSAAPCMKKREKKKVVRRTMSIGSIVLDWVQEMVKDYPIEIKNFSSSWNDGMAFCALIHHFNPDEFDYNELKPENKKYNFDLAFNTGMKVRNIPILLDTEDMVRMPKPEPRSVQCYIQWIWSVYGPTSGYGPTPKEVQSA